MLVGERKSLFIGISAFVGYAKTIQDVPIA